MINRLLASLAAVAFLSLAAHASTPQAPNSVDANNLSATQPMNSIEFIGCVPLRVEASTVPVLVATGSGQLFELNTTSGTSANAYAIAFDSGSLKCSGGAALTPGCATAALGVNAVSQLPSGYAITPRIFTDNGGSASAPTVAGQGRFAPPQPRHFLNGLVISNSDAGVNTTGCYRTDAMNAANPLVQ